MPAGRDKIESMFWKRTINIGTAVLAAAITPAVTSVLFSLPSISYLSLLFINIIFLFALAHAAILGLPTYLILSPKRKLTCTISTFAGLIIGGVPMTFIYFSDLPDHLGMIAGAAFYGALGGFAFWLTLHILDKPDSITKHRFSFVSLQTIFPLAVVLASISILMIPNIIDLIWT